MRYKIGEEFFVFLGRVRSVTEEMRNWLCVMLLLWLPWREGGGGGSRISRSRKPLLWHDNQILMEPNKITYNAYHLWSTSMMSDRRSIIFISTGRHESSLFTCVLRRVYGAELVKIGRIQKWHSCFFSSSAWVEGKKSSKSNFLLFILNIINSLDSGGKSEIGSVHTSPWWWIEQEETFSKVDWQFFKWQVLKLPQYMFSFLSINWKAKTEFHPPKYSIWESTKRGSP